MYVVSICWKSEFIVVYSDFLLLELCVVGCGSQHRAPKDKAVFQGCSRCVVISMSCGLL